MLNTLTFKFWEPFFRVAKIDDGCPVKVVYGCPEGEISILHDDISKAENVFGLWQDWQWQIGFFTCFY